MFDLLIRNAHIVDGTGLPSFYGEIGIINSFLPSQLIDTETLKICQETIKTLKAQGPQDIGNVIGTIKKKYAEVLDFSKKIRPNLTFMGYDVWPSSAVNEMRKLTNN